MSKTCLIFLFNAASKQKFIDIYREELQLIVGSIFGREYLVISKSFSWIEYTLSTIVQNRKVEFLRFLFFLPFISITGSFRSINCQSQNECEKEKQHTHSHIRQISSIIKLIHMQILLLCRLVKLQNILFIYTANVMNAWGNMCTQWYLKCMTSGKQSQEGG